MTFTSLAAKTGIAAVALTALGLGAAMPAAAHTSNMYTYVYYDDNNQQAYFATYGKTDGVTAALPTSFLAQESSVYGIEVANEKGTAIGSDGEFFVREWNHTTGERGDTVPVFLSAGVPASLDRFLGLDTLNDGRTVTLVQYFTGGEPVVQHWAIATVNSTTGELVPILDITSALLVEGDVFYEPTSLATDPATGITHVFVRSDADRPGFMTGNVATGDLTDPVLFQHTDFALGEVNGVDFDASTGELYFNYDSYESDYMLLKFTTPSSTWGTAEPDFISFAPDNDGVQLDQLALTIEHTTLAATGSELPIAAWLLVGTLAVLAGGATVMVARRRAEAGTV